MDDDGLLPALERMTGDRRLARAVVESLSSLADGTAGPELAEMAADLLAGRISLESIGRSSVYGESLTRAMTDFTNWYRRAADDERHRAMEDARTRLDARVQRTRAE